MRLRSQDRAQWEVKELDVSVAEWTLSGGINLYKVRCVCYANFS